MKFAKRSEQNYTDEIFIIIKVIRPIYELEVLNGTLIKGQFTGRSLHLFASLNVQFVI